jgi:hypothetical protein
LKNNKNTKKENFKENETMAYLNILDFGAKGDGKTDDTEALIAAMKRATETEGTVYFPAGTYNIRPVKVPSHITLLGNSAWAYVDRRAFTEHGRTVLSAIPGDDKAKALLDMDGVLGTRVIGLTLIGNGVGECLHGVYSKHPGIEQNIVFEDCRIVNFTGSGLRLDNVWVAAVRRCIILQNKLHGIDWSKGYDGWVIDNQIADNGGAGLFAGKDPSHEFHKEVFEVDGYSGMGTVTCTGNRIEWNKIGGVVLYTAMSMQINGCSFDNNFGPAVKFVRCTHSTVSAGIFRSGGVNEGGKESSHIYLEDCRGVAVNGNSFYGWFGPPNLHKGAAPHYGFFLKNLRCCIVANNALFEAGSEAAALDHGGHIDSRIELDTYVKPDLSSFVTPETE